LVSGCGKSGAEVDSVMVGGKSGAGGGDAGVSSGGGKSGAVGGDGGVSSGGGKSGAGGGDAGVSSGGGKSGAGRGDAGPGVVSVVKGGAERTRGATGLVSVVGTGAGVGGTNAVAFGFSGPWTNGRANAFSLRTAGQEFSGRETFTRWICSDLGAGALGGCESVAGGAVACAFPTHAVELTAAGAGR
jgi:hypothetical protein